jgi:mycothiol synthase
MSRKYAIRNYRDGDLPRIKRMLRNLARSTIQDGGLISDLEQRLIRPGYRPEENMFIVEAGRRCVGYLEIIPELNIDRVVLLFDVLKDWRVPEVTGPLFEKALDQSKRLGIHFAHIDVPAFDLETAVMLSAQGFYIVRSFYEFKLDVQQTAFEYEHDVSLRFGHLNPGEEQQLAELQNCSFHGNWGYNPEAVDDVLWRMQYRSTCAEDVMMAYDEDRAVGFCWTGTDCGLEPVTKRKIGRIFMIGVDPGYRGKGIGKSLLVEALAYCKGKGSEIVSLNVDSQNASAISLYLSMGFAVSQNVLSYERVVC